MTSKTIAAGGHDGNDIVYPETLPFVLTHLVCLAAIWTGVRAIDVAVCLGLYVVRMIVVTAVYHRYFSHKSFKTSRLMQFVLAFLVQTAAQRGVVWWAATHREHHLHSDTPQDVHSPRHHGFWYSHVGWIFSPQRSEADYSLVPDLTKYPELMFLNSVWMRYTPAALLGFAIWFLMGWSGLVVAFFWSTVLLYHGSFSINSLAHVHGNQRYLTGDDSRNNFWLALLTMGEGWHNNHHHYQNSTRQGFFWWEVDVTYYCLKVLSWLGLVWDLTEPPEHVVANDRRLGLKVIDKVAHQLAYSFPLERIGEQLSEAWQQAPGKDELLLKLHAARHQAGAALAEIHLPHVPTLDELRDRAREMFAHSPSLDDIVKRAHQIMIENLSARIGPELAASPA